MRRGLAIALLGLILAGGVLVVYRATYHNWPWQGSPARLTWCGRVYVRSEAAPVTRRKIGRPPTNVVFRAPPLIGRQVLSDLTAQQVAARRRRSDVCGFGLYMRTSDSRHFVLYDLSGGP